MVTTYTERKCHPCDVCEGTGTQFTEKTGGILVYDVCVECDGNQCFVISNGVMGDYISDDDGCDGSCGRNRKLLHKFGME